MNQDTSHCVTFSVIIPLHGCDPYNYSSENPSLFLNSLNFSFHDKNSTLWSNSFVLPYLPPSYVVYSGADFNCHNTGFSSQYQCDFSSIVNPYLSTFSELNNFKYSISAINNSDTSKTFCSGSSNSTYLTCHGSTSDTPPDLGSRFTVNIQFAKKYNLQNSTAAGGEFDYDYNVKPFQMVLN